MQTLSCNEICDTGFIFDNILFRVLDLWDWGTNCPINIPNVIIPDF